MLVRSILGLLILPNLLVDMSKYPSLPPRGWSQGMLSNGVHLTVVLTVLQHPECDR